jgi:hypothetical protein
MTRPRQSMSHRWSSRIGDLHRDEGQRRRRQLLPPSAENVLSDAIPARHLRLRR